MVTLSLATLILIALGGLVLVAVIWWQLKEFVDKRRKHSKTHDVDNGVPMKDRPNLEESKPTLAASGPRRPTHIHGSFSSNAHGRPASPAPSYKLNPRATLVDWGQMDKGNGAPSIRSLSQQESRNMSISSIASPIPTRHRPSPLRPDNHRSLSASTVGGIGGSYMPPLPSPRSLRCGTPDSFKPAGVPSTWISPLDVHFSRPSTPNANSRPPSFLPQLQFPGELEQNALLIPSPNGSIHNSEVASIINSDSSSNKAPPLAKPMSQSAEAPQSKPPNFSVFPPGPPPRSARQSSRSIFPMTTEPERPPSRRKPSDINTQIANVRLPPIPRDPHGTELPNFDFGNFQGPKWSPGEAIFRDSVVSKQRVSVYRPPMTPRSREASPDMPKNRIASVAASSMYSTTTSILNTPGDVTFPPLNSRIRSQSDDRRRTRSRSTSSHRLSRTQDSLRRHSRKLSQASKNSEARNSRGRDQLHYDPRPHHRDHSGSVHGRKVDFDHPRESPFSNFHATSDHSTNSSVSTTVSTVPSTESPHIQPRGRPEARNWELEKLPQIPKLDLNLRPLQPQLHPEIDPTRLSINPFMANGTNRLSNASRNRSASEVSQSSIGDFYDAYFRQSILAQRASIAAQTQGASARTGAGDLMVSGGGNLAGFNFNQNQIAAAQTHGAGRRLQPLNFSRGGLAGQTIVEVQSPGTTPGMSPRQWSGGERFPERI